MAGFCVSGFKVQPVGPPPPPPPPAAVTVGLGPYLNVGFPGPSVKIFTLPTVQPLEPTGIPVQVGDILVAAMAGWNTSNQTMAGHLPSGWVLVREDYQVASQSMYTGIAYKVAVSADTVAQNVLTDVPAYVFGNPFAFLGVGLACVHNSAGIDTTAYTSRATGNASLSIAGATASQAGELVLLLAYAGTPAGATYINAGTDNSNSNASDLPRCTANGFTDSALRIFYLNAPTAGTSPSHDIIPAPGAFQTTFPVAGYMVTMLGA